MCAMPVIESVTVNLLINWLAYFITEPHSVFRVKNEFVGQIVGVLLLCALLY